MPQLMYFVAHQAKTTPKLKKVNLLSSGTTRCTIKYMKKFVYQNRPIICKNTIENERNSDDMKQRMLTFPSKSPTSSNCKIHKSVHTE